MRQRQRQAGLGKRFLDTLKTAVSGMYLQALEHIGFVTSEVVGRERISMNLPLLEALKG